MSESEVVPPRPQWMPTGQTDMPEEEVQAIAAFVGITVKEATAVVWLTEQRCREKNGG